MHGMPCTCAMKREGHDGDDLSKLAAHNAAHSSLAHRLVHSYNPKPTMSNRRSDSVVPKFQPGHHPQLHRHNFAAHEFGHPYAIKKYSRSTDNFDWSMSSRSADSLPLSPHNGMAYQQPLPDITSAPRQDRNQHPRVSSPAGGSDVSTPGHAPYFPGSGMNSPVLINSPGAAQDVSSAPRQDYFPSPTLDTSGFDGEPPRSHAFTSPMDINFMNTQQSPANPQRYSLNDFSTFNWTDLEQPMLSASPSSDHLPHSPADFSIDPTVAYNPLNHTPPPRSSIMASVEHPGMCYSPSAASVSDAGESIANSGEHNMITSVPRQATPLDASFMTRDYKEPFSGGDLKASTYPGTPSSYNQAGNRSSATSFDDYLSLPTSAPIQDMKNNYSEISRLAPTPPPMNQDNTAPVTSSYEVQPPMDQWSLSPQPQAFYSPQPDMNGFGGSGTFA